MIKNTFRFLLLSLLFLFGFSHIYSQTCLTDSLIKQTNIDKKTFQGVFETASKWLPGQKISIQFLDGDDYVKSKVKFYAKKWEEFANVKFEFLESSFGQADIRISFKYNGSWSFVGKSSQIWSSDGRTASTNKNGASMNFGWFNSKTTELEFQRTTLHEFGHALGLLHEHQNINRTFEWNIPVVLNYYMTTQGWSKDEVYQQVINRYDNGTEYTNRAYDKDSIMHYRIDGSFLKNGISIGGNSNLSNGDISIIREMYPFENSVADAAITFSKIDVKHNVYMNENMNVFFRGELGMKIKIDFYIKTSYKTPYFIYTYFRNEDGTPIKERGTGGAGMSPPSDLAVGTSFTPANSMTTYGTELFMPNEKFLLPCGYHKLKFFVAIFKGNEYKQIATSGYTYFSFNETRGCNKLII